MLQRKYFFSKVNRCLASASNRLSSLPEWLTWHVLAGTMITWTTPNLAMVRWCHITSSVVPHITPQATELLMCNVQYIWCHHVATKMAFYNIHKFRDILFFLMFTANDPSARQVPAEDYGLKCTACNDNRSLRCLCSMHCKYVICLMTLKKARVNIVLCSTPCIHPAALCAICFLTSLATDRAVQ